jgi:hypothetical protein
MSAENIVFQATISMVSYSPEKNYEIGKWYYFNTDTDDVILKGPFDSEATAIKERDKND